MADTARGETRRQAGDYFTPAEYAKRLGVGAKKVLAWIKSGELKAINVSEGNKRPRFLIPAESTTDFELSRSNATRQAATKKRKAVVSSSVPRKF